MASRHTLGVHTTLRCNAMSLENAINAFGVSTPLVNLCPHSHLEQHRTHVLSGFSGDTEATICDHCHCPFSLVDLSWVPWWQTQEEVRSRDAAGFTIWVMLFDVGYFLFSFVLFCFLFCQKLSPCYRRFDHSHQLQIVESGGVFALFLWAFDSTQGTPTIPK